MRLVVRIRAVLSFRIGVRATGREKRNHLGVLIKVQRDLARWFSADLGDEIRTWGSASTVTVSELFGGRIHQSKVDGLASPARETLVLESQIYAIRSGQEFAESSAADRVAAYLAFCSTAASSACSSACCQLGSRSYSFIALAKISVFLPRSFWYTTPSSVTMNVITPDDLYSAG